MHCDPLNETTSMLYLLSPIETPTFPVKIRTMMNIITMYEAKPKRKLLNGRIGTVGITKILFSGLYSVV